MGSTVFYKYQQKGDIDCAIILDLVGHDTPIKGCKDAMFITGMESHPSLENVLRSTPVEDPLQISPILNAYVGSMGDHHVFNQNNRPYLFMSCGRWEHYHMPTDTPEKLNYEKMGSVAAYLAKVIMQCDKTDFPQGGLMYDTVRTEAEFMNKAFSDFFRRYSIEPVKTREDITSALVFMATFGL